MHVCPNYVTIVITADFFPFGVGSGDMIGSQEVDAADAISVDSPVVFFLQNHSNIFVSALHTLAIMKVASIGLETELFNTSWKKC